MYHKPLWPLSGLVHNAYEPKAIENKCRQGEVRRDSPLWIFGRESYS